MNLSKWGNSYALRIPKELVDEYDLLSGELEFERGKHLAIKKRPKKQQLQALLKNMESSEEIEWGAARGREIW